MPRLGRITPPAAMLPFRPPRAVYLPRAGPDRRPSAGTHPRSTAARLPGTRPPRTAERRPAPRDQFPPRQTTRQLLGERTVQPTPSLTRRPAILVRASP